MTFNDFFPANFRHYAEVSVALSEDTWQDYGQHAHVGERKRVNKKGKKKCY